MTKTELAQELKKEFAKGNLKPSKIKKSKSLGDLPKVQSAEPLNRSKSNPELEPANSKFEQLETKISVLELQLETSQRELTELNSYKENNSFLTQENEHLKEQNKNKQKELENLRGKLESIQAELNSLKSEQSTLLDQNLTLKHQGLKDWFSQYEKTQKVEQELAQNIEYASNELLTQDQQINNLQSQITKLKQTKQSLQKDLDLTSKLLELRKEPYFANEFNSQFKYLLYSVIAVSLVIVLMRKGEVRYNEPSF